MKTLMVALVALLISTEAYATDWYVDGSQAVNQQTQTGSEHAPFGAFWQAARAAKPDRNIGVKGNVVHNAGRDGINIFGCDYVSVEDNTVYGNAKNTSDNIF